MFLHLFILPVISASGADPPEVEHNPPKGAPQISTVVQGECASQESKNQVQVSTPVPTIFFTETLQGTLVFTTTHIKILVEDGYDTQEAVPNWKFIDIQ